MPNLSFSLDVGSVLSPLLVVCIGVLIAQARKGITRHFDARHDAVEEQVQRRHKETTEHLNAIEAQTTATNGRVTKLEEGNQADHDMLLTLKGSVETLMSLRKGEPPQ